MQIFSPDILGWSSEENSKISLILLDVLAILAQITALLIWPVLSDLWFIPLALFLISFRWWENFVTPCSRFGKENLYFLYTLFEKKKRSFARYHPFP